MTTIDGLWVISLLAGAGMLLTLGFGFVLLTRSLATPGIPVRCPMSGHLTLVQHIAEEGGYLTDVVTCGAFPHAQPITCGMPCLTGGVRTRVSERPRDLLEI